MIHNRLRLLVLLPMMGLASALAIGPQSPVLASSTTTDPRDKEAIRQILDLERQAKDASIHRDAAFAERALADDYVGITPLGQVVTKSDTVAARKSGQLRYESIEISDLVVRVYGNMAIVTARADVKGIDLGEEFNGPYRFTRIWVRRNGRWQAVSYQATVTR